MQEQIASIAERFMRGLYGGDLSVVDELASDDILLSYPVFETLFDAPTIRGRRAARRFGKRFSNRWAEGQLTVHESITEGETVVLVWSFQARNVGPIPHSGPPTNELHSWGGISLFKFDTSRKIEAEIGEESSPGPFARTQTGKVK